MSDASVEMVARAFAAFNRRDQPALLESCHPEIEWVPMRASKAGTVYRGREGVRRAIDDVSQEFDELHNDPRRWTDLGERVVVAGRFVAKERGTGLRIDNPGAWLCEVREGLVSRVEAFPSEEAALRAAREGR